MPTFALFLVILGNGSLGNSQPLRIGNFLSLSNCQAAAHDGNYSVANSVGAMSEVIYGRCIDQEQSAHDDVKTLWNTLPTQTQNWCDRVARSTGDGSYVLLNGCVGEEITAGHENSKRQVRG